MLHNQTTLLAPEYVPAEAVLGRASLATTSTEMQEMTWFLPFTPHKTCRKQQSNYLLEGLRRVRLDKVLLLLGIMALTWGQASSL